MKKQYFLINSARMATILWTVISPLYQLYFSDNFLLMIVDDIIIYFSCGVSPLLLRSIRIFWHKIFKNQQNKIEESPQCKHTIVLEILAIPYFDTRSFFQKEGTWHFFVLPTFLKFSFFLIFRWCGKFVLLSSSEIIIYETAELLKS